MMTVVPAAGVMIIAMIIMGFIAARQGERHNEGEKPDADKILYSVFHERWFMLIVLKSCQMLNVAIRAL